MKIIVYHPRVANRLEEAVVEHVGAVHEVYAVDDAEDFRRHVSEYDVVLASRCPPGSITEEGQVKWVQLLAGDHDHLAAMKIPARVRVTHGPIGTTRQATAEFVMMSMLMLARGAGALIRNSDSDHAWLIPEGRLLSGRQVTVLGVGRIGARVMDFASAFGMRVLGYCRKPRATPNKEFLWERSKLLHALKETEHLVVALPRTHETAEFVNAELIQAMPRGAMLTSVARGNVVCFPALVEALRSGHLSGALVDCLPKEPLASDDPLWTVPNLIVTPHWAYYHDNWFYDLGALVSENIRKLLSNSRLVNEIKREPSR